MACFLTEAGRDVLAGVMGGKQGVAGAQYIGFSTQDVQAGQTGLAGEVYRVAVGPSVISSAQVTFIGTATQVGLDAAQAGGPRVLLTQLRSCGLFGNGATRVAGSGQCLGLWSLPGGITATTSFRVNMPVNFTT